MTSIHLVVLITIYERVIVWTGPTSLLYQSAVTSDCRVRVALDFIAVCPRLIQYDSDEIHVDFQDVIIWISKLYITGTIIESLKIPIIF